MSKLLVLYHADCTDGFAAAWVCHQVHPDAEYVPVKYGYEPPDVTGREVLILDFSYPRAVLLEMKAKARKLEVIDHHKTAEAELKGLEAFCHFDMTKSGAMLTWEWFNPNERPPMLIGYVQDRDLWEWKLVNSKEINAAIRSYPTTFEAWDGLYDLETRQGAFTSLIREGAAILRAEAQIVGFHVKRANGVKLASGETIMCCNATTCISEIGNELAKGRPFSATYMVREDGRFQYSLRSDRDGANTDVAEIAKQYGGGGHHNAAGFVSHEKVF